MRFVNILKKLWCKINFVAFNQFAGAQKWAEIIGQARQSVDYLKDQDVIRTVLNIMQVYVSILFDIDVLSPMAFVLIEDMAVLKALFQDVHGHEFLSHN